MKKKSGGTEVMHALEEAGGARSGVARAVSGQTGVPEATLYGVSTFYTLLAKPDVELRICQGTSCALAGAFEHIAEARANGVKVEAVSCLGQCDRAPAALDARLEPVIWGGEGHVLPADPELPIDLGGADTAEWSALEKAKRIGAEAVIDEIRAAGLQGRGGAGFPAHIKWSGVRSQAETERYVVVNADEGEPGTFKDREVMLRRPHRMLEGLAIAAWAVGAKVAWIYIRGEFQACRRALERALAEAKPDLEVRFYDGHGAYICGEETALLESLEGKRGMPRLKPPFPTEAGLFGKPTLIHNVETLACVPAIVERGGDWFRGLGRTEAGSKLYCISGHVEKPGVYELPIGVTLEELVQHAGGYVGTPKAFSPGGASSGFLPMAFRDTPLDFKSLQAAGSMLGSAGVVVLNDSVDMAEAARWGQVFFEDETCGQCAPCRIGCSLQRQSIDRYLADRDAEHLAHVGVVHGEMDEGSICGLGMTASLPLLSAMKHFPGDFV
ncbi:MAG: SLBB domain-containing protein [Alphaproteobacteria bacterium]|nr:SLBB domain-containing protein [Alphaproteobacteria bacterium]